MKRLFSLIIDHTHPETTEVRGACSCSCHLPGSFERHIVACCNGPCPVCNVWIANWDDHAHVCGGGRQMVLKGSYLAELVHFATDTKWRIKEWAPWDGRTFDHVTWLRIPTSEERQRVLTRLAYSKNPIECRAPWVGEGAAEENVLHQSVEEQEYSQWRKQVGLPEREEYTREVRGMSPEITEREKFLKQLAQDYLFRTESFDRGICTGPIIRGSIQPAGPGESSRSSSHANSILKEMRETLRPYGIFASELMETIRDESQHFDFDKELEKRFPQIPMSKENPTNGEIAYGAYAQSRDWKAFNGDPLPTYEQMKQDPKRQDLIPSWEAAGDAVACAHSPGLACCPQTKEGHTKSASSEALADHSSRTEQVKV